MGLADIAPLFSAIAAIVALFINSKALKTNEKQITNNTKIQLLDKRIKLVILTTSIVDVTKYIIQFLDDKKGIRFTKLSIDNFRGSDSPLVFLYKLAIQDICYSLDINKSDNYIEILAKKLAKHNLSVKFNDLDYSTKLEPQVEQIKKYQSELFNVLYRYSLESKIIFDETYGSKINTFLLAYRDFCNSIIFNAENELYAEKTLNECLQKIGCSSFGLDRRSIWEYGVCLLVRDNADRSQEYKRLKAAYESIKEAIDSGGLRKSMTVD